ncbi:MAG: hypothetical protein AAB482_01445, partial [Patescibacteria group bacterium]
FDKGMGIVRNIFNRFSLQNATAAILPVQWAGCAVPSFYISPSVQAYSLSPILLQGRQAWINVGSKLSIGSFLNESNDRQPDVFDNRNTISLVPGTQSVYSYADNRLVLANMFMGFANIRDVNGIIIEADILLNKDAMFGVPGGESSILLQNVFTHELGHVFGLAHEKTNPHNVMFSEEYSPTILTTDYLSYLTDGVMQLTADDKSSLIFNYNICL